MRLLGLWGILCVVAVAAQASASVAGEFVGTGTLTMHWAGGDSDTYDAQGEGAFTGNSYAHGSGTYWPEEDVAKILDGGDLVFLSADESYAWSIDGGDGDGECSVTFSSGYIARDDVVFVNIDDGFAGACGGDPSQPNSSDNPIIFSVHINEPELA